MVNYVSGLTACRTMVNYASCLTACSENRNIWFSLEPVVHGSIHYAGFQLLLLSSSHGNEIARHLIYFLGVRLCTEDKCFYPIVLLYKLHVLEEIKRKN